MQKVTKPKLHEGHLKRTIPSLPDVVGPDTYLLVTSMKGRGARHHTDCMLQQCASQHHNSMELQHQQH